MRVSLWSRGCREAEGIKIMLDIVRQMSAEMHQDRAANAYLNARVALEYGDIENAIFWQNAQSYWSFEVRCDMEISHKDQLYA
jgi:surface antigen